MHGEYSHVRTPSSPAVHPARSHERCTSYFFPVGNFDVADYQFGRAPNRATQRAQIDMVLRFADEGSQYALEAWEAFTAFLKRHNRGTEGGNSSTTSSSLLSMCTTSNGSITWVNTHATAISSWRGNLNMGMRKDTRTSASTVAPKSGRFGACWRAASTAGPV